MKPVVSCRPEDSKVNNLKPVGVSTRRLQGTHRTRKLLTLLPTGSPPPNIPPSRPSGSVIAVRRETRCRFEAPRGPAPSLALCVPLPPVAADLPEEEAVEVGGEGVTLGPRRRSLVVAVVLVEGGRSTPTEPVPPRLSVSRGRCRSITTLDPSGRVKGSSRDF